MKMISVLIGSSVVEVAHLDVRLNPIHLQEALSDMRTDKD